MNAKKYIEDALVTLLRKKSIDKIKVSEVIREVEICKGTFYKYYCDKYELLQSCFDNRVYGALEKCENWEEFVLGVLDAFSKMPEATLNAFDSSDVNSIRIYHEDKMVGYLSKGMDMQAASKTCLMSMKICASAFTDIMLRWLRGGMKESKEEIISYMRAAMPNSITRICITA